MTSQSDSLQLMKPGLLGEWIAERLNIWQMNLLDEWGLASFANERGLAFRNHDIRQLWQLKLLRADLVASDRKLRLAGLIGVAKDDLDRYLYADERQPRRRAKGWSSAAAELRPLPSGVELYFHPFRYYVLYHLDRILKINIHPMQMLVAIERYPEILDYELSRFQRWSGDYAFTQNVDHWNNVAALAIATEPCAYERLFHSLRYPLRVGAEAQRKHMEEHWTEVAKCYQEIGIDQIEKIRQDLCISAQSLDSNKNVHTVLRLTQGAFRRKIKGRLGGALVLLTMAEMMRRATEAVFDVKLREEDELGFGITPLGVKEKLYGSDRILDGNRTVVNQFLRQFGLDYGLRLRWYVEGYTEYGALDSVLGRFSAVELINLKGNVVQKGGKGVAFAESLRSDLKAKIFSFVLIDEDNDEYVRVVRKAAEEDEICGMFFISEPDFELGNFTLPALEEILWEIAVDNGACPEARKKLHNALNCQWQVIKGHLWSFRMPHLWSAKCLSYGQLECPIYGNENAPLLGMT